MALTLNSTTYENNMRIKKLFIYFSLCKYYEQIWLSFQIYFLCTTAGSQTQLLYYLQCTARLTFDELASPKGFCISPGCMRIPAFTWHYWSSVGDRRLQVTSSSLVCMDQIDWMSERATECIKFVLRIKVACQSQHTAYCTFKAVSTKTVVSVFDSATSWISLQRRQSALA